MEVLIIFLLLVFIIIYTNANNAQKNSIEFLKNQVASLINETRELKKELQKVSFKAQDSPAQSPPVDKPAPAPITKPAREVFIPEPIKPPADVPAPAPKPAHVEAYKEVPQPVHKPMSVVDEESWWDKFIRNNPDLEKFIGENLINKIGIAVLVLGISFFVKYAIDKEWINEVGRVGIGIFSGALLVALAHYLRNSYRSFSSVLAGGGIAVFYFTIAFAFHQYALINQTSAFLIMVVITGFACALSILYDRIELAVIAALGGFLTPFMVSTGEGNYIVLFVYLIILNSGLLALAFFKRWPLINIISLFFTVIIFGGWLTRIYLEEPKNISYPLALLFASVFYLLFIGMNVIYQVRYKKDFKAFDYSILLLLNVSYFAAGMFLLSRVEKGVYQGMFTLGVGLINLILARFFFKRQGTDKKLLYLLIGLTLTYLSLTIPVQLEGHAITLFWSAEMVLLLWLYQKSRINLFFYSSLLVTGLTLVSLLMDWTNVVLRDSSSLVLIYNDTKGLITNIVAVLALVGYALLLKKESEGLPGGFGKKIFYQLYWLGAFVIGYLTAIYGINLLFKDSTGYEVPNVYHRLVTEGLVFGLLIWQLRKRPLFYDWIVPAAFMVYLAYHLGSYSLIEGLRNGVLSGRHASIHLGFHWASVVVALVLLFYIVQDLRKSSATSFISLSRTAWILSIAMVIFFSQEFEHIVISLRPADIPYMEEQYSKAILTIVWALCSFGLMWLGMKYRNKILRIISLSLFSLALLKLFFIDIANVSEGGKIVAFILLGVLLLTISFMYQKLKKILINDSKE